MHMYHSVTGEPFCFVYAKLAVQTAAKQLISLHTVTYKVV